MFTFQPLKTAKPNKFKAKWSIGFLTLYGLSIIIWFLFWHFLSESSFSRIFDHLVLLFVFWQHASNCLPLSAKTLFVFWQQVSPYFSQLTYFSATSACLVFVSMVGVKASKKGTLEWLIIVFSIVFSNFCCYLKWNASPMK